MSAPAEIVDFLPYWSEPVQALNPHPDHPDVGPILILTQFSNISRACLAAGAPGERQGRNQLDAVGPGGHDWSSWAQVPTVGESGAPDPRRVTVQNGGIGNPTQATRLAEELKGMHDGFRDHFGIDSYFMTDATRTNALGLAIISSEVVTHSALTPSGEHQFEMPAQGLVVAFLRLALRRAAFTENRRQATRELPPVPQALALPQVPAAPPSAEGFPKAS